MINMRLAIEFGDDTVELAQGTNFVHPMDQVQRARQMLEKINSDAEAWFAARDRPPDPRGRPIKDSPQA